MATAPGPVKYVIFDLDGLLLDTETLCVDVAREVLARYGKELTHEAHKAALGKRPLECWQAVSDLLGLPVGGAALLAESEPMLTDRWADAALMPGALRLLQHLHTSGVPFAIGTSTPRATFNKKMSDKPGVRSMCTVVVCGDEVPNGKPFPDVFLEAARKLGASPAECLVLEDAPSGAEAAIAAGMRVAVVPSMLELSDYPPADASCSVGVSCILPSLLAFQPQFWGLPPFSDLVHDIIPLDSIIRIRGPVVRGFGRGSKQLGIPTANVDTTALASALSQAVTGIYAGWASVGDSAETYKMVMSIGWNPYFKSRGQQTQKTAEPWLLHEFEKEFYGQEIRLVICAYVRPECDFTSLEALIGRIRTDASMSTVALQDGRLSGFQHDAFLSPPALLAAA
ncbi:MAG: hypothetical protein WDW38_011321 [Sanguina aurantia]